MAALNLNKVILAGHLADTPELKQTTGANPVSVCKIRVIVNRPRKQDGTDGGMDAFDVVVWRGTAEFVCRYFRKGSAVCVIGAIQNRSYEKNGEKRWITEIVADEVKFVDSAATGTQNGAGAPQNSAGGAKAQAATNNAPANAAPQQQPYMQPAYASNDDDLPF